jgi:hypothetical protein
MEKNPGHIHLKPLSPQPQRPKGPLDGDVFGALVGTIDHVTLQAAVDPKFKDNHVYLWFKVNWGPHSGRYECALNTESILDNIQVQYCVRVEEITPGDFPSIGFWKAELSYKRLGLTQKDFHPIFSGTLRSLIYHYSENCNLAAAYGVTYTEGNGLHDIHMNSGEKKGGKNPNRELQDGALVFYNRHETTASRRTWIFTKFASQSL